MFTLEDFILAVVGCMFIISGFLFIFFGLFVAKPTIELLVLFGLVLLFFGVILFASFLVRIRLD